MSEPFGILVAVWSAVLVHLWQTTLILVPLILLGRFLYRASARQQEVYWSLLLGKIVLPISIGAPLATWLWRRLPDGLGNELAAGATPLLQTIETVWLAGGTFRSGSVLDSPWATAAILTGTVAWLIGFLLIGRRTMSELAAQVRLRRSGRPVTSLAASQTHRLLQAADRVGIPHRHLLIVESMTMPAVAGFRRPDILLPACLVARLETDELAAILQHEESHRRRRDPLRALLMRLILMLLFFYPPLHVIMRKLGETAEFTGDERVLDAGILPRDLARALALATQLYLCPEPLATASGSGGGSLLQRRLRRLADPERKTMPHYRVLIVLAALAVCLGAFVPQTMNRAAATAVSADEPAPATTTNPELIHMAQPQYPEDALKAKAAGTVYVKVLVGVEGKVVEAEVAKGVEDYPSLDQAALEAAKACEFKPATRDGDAVQAWVMIPFHFRMS